MGLFDDLIPAKEASRGHFADLIPDEAPATEDFDAQLAWTRAKFPQLSKPDAIRTVATKLKRSIPDDPTAFEAFTDTIAGLPGEATKSVIRTGLTAPLRLVSRVGQQFTGDSSQIGPKAHEAAPLERIANAVDDSAELAFPSPEQPGLETSVAQGVGQVGTMLGGGAVLKGMGAGAKLIGGGMLAQMGASEFDDAFEASVARGDDADTAVAKALGYGTVAALIENRLGAGRLWRQMFPSAELAAKKLTGLGVSRAIGANILAGGAEEGLQRASQNLIVEEKPSMEGVVEEAIPGAIIEGALGLPASVGNRVAQGRKFDAEKAALDFAVNESALQGTFPTRGQAGVVANRNQDRSFERTGLFDDLIPKTSESQSAQSASASNTDGKQQTPGAAVPTDATAGASPDQAAKVRAELQAATVVEPDASTVQAADDTSLPLTKGDLPAVAAELLRQLRGNQLSPDVSPQPASVATALPGGAENRISTAVSSENEPIAADVGDERPTPVTLPASTTAERSDIVYEGGPANRVRQSPPTNTKRVMYGQKGQEFAYVDSGRTDAKGARVFVPDGNQSPQAILTQAGNVAQPSPNAPQVTLPRSPSGIGADIVQQESATEATPAAPEADAVEAWLNKAIDATELKQGELLEGVTGAPVWITKSAANGALKVIRSAYRVTKDATKAVQHGIAWLKDRKIKGFNEAEARAWLQKLAEDEGAQKTATPASKSNPKAGGSPTQTAQNAATPAQATPPPSATQTPPRTGAAAGNTAQPATPPTAQPTAPSAPARAIGSKGPFTDSATTRAVRSMLRGQPVPKEFRDVQAKYLGVQKYFEEALRLSIVAARKRVYQEFKTKPDREAAMDRVGKYWLGQIPLNAVGGPQTQLAAETFRNELDALAMTAAANGMVPDSQVRTWIGNTGEWLKRTYLAFDPTSDWNYDQLNKRRAKEPEIQRIWQNAENYLRTQNPKATPNQIEAEMRSLIDRREVESALFGSAPGESRSGYGANTSSLIKRKDIPPELLDWMGQIKDPIARAQQSAKWMSQFLARNLMQRELAKVGLEAGWFTRKAEGRNHVELYPNVSKLTPVVDPVTGATVKAPSGNIEAEYRSNIDRRHEPLHGLYTSPEMLAALQQFDGMLNTGMAAASRLTNLVPSAILKGVGFWKMGKVALNPISYPVNSFGAIVMRLMAGAVNPLHVGNALLAVASRRAVIDKNSSVMMQRARANYLLATKQGITGKGIFTREIDASFGRESEPQSGRRAMAALADLVKGRGAGGARVRLGRALLDMLKVPGEIGIKWADDVARVSAFLDEFKLSKEANPTFTEQQHADWAAERAGNIYQTYDNLPVAIRDASNIGVLSPFISFTAEMFRNAGWIAVYGQRGLRSDNPALRRDGAQKLAGLAAMAVLPIVLSVLTRSTADDDDEKAKRKIEALQRWFTPPWDRGEDMMLVSFNRDRIEYIPMSYLLPTAQLSRIPRQVAKISDNENPTRAINQLVDGAMEDVFGSGPIGTALEAMMNTRGEGRKITRAEGFQGWQDRAAYAWQNFRPGVVQLADEWFMAQAGEKGFGGREYTTEEIGMKLAGLRVRTVSPKQAIPFVMRDFNQRWRDASAVATLQAERTPTNKEAIKEAQDYKATKQAEIKKDYAQFLKDSELIGWKKTEVMMLAGEEKIYLSKELKDSVK